MATGINIAIETLENIFIKTTTIGGNYWLIQGTVILVTLILLTRKVSDWKQLTFPIVIGWHTFGMRMPWIFMVGAGTMFVIDTLSMQTISTAIEGIKRLSQTTFRTGSPKSVFKQRVREFKEGYQKRSSAADVKRLDIREEMSDLEFKKMTFNQRRKVKAQKAEMMADVFETTGRIDETGFGEYRKAQKIKEADAAAERRAIEQEIKNEQALYSSIAKEKKQYSPTNKDLMITQAMEELNLKKKKKKVKKRREE